MVKKKKTVKKKADIKKNNHIWSNVLGIAFIFLCIFSYIALIFKNTGWIGSITKNLLLGFLGLGAYIFPVLFALYSITLLGKKKKFIITKRYGAMVLTFINLLNVLFLISRDLFSYERFDIIDFYADSYIFGVELKGAGILGNTVGKLVYSLLGFYGMITLILFTMGVAVLLFKNIDFHDALEILKSKWTGKKIKNSEEKKESPELREIKINEVIPSEVIQEEKTVSFDPTPTVFDYKKELKGLITTEKIAPVEQKAEKATITQEEVVPAKKPIAQGQAPIIPTINQQENKIENLQYQFPSIDLLGMEKTKNTHTANKEALNNANVLNQMLKSFGIGATVSNITIGPAITRYELQLNPGVKVSKIVNLSDDISLALAAPGIRIEAPIPGKSAVGIEVPNKSIAAIRLRDILDSSEFKNSKSKITFGIGKDIAGATITADLSKMPHLLIAGATGSGKSVCINTLITSILYKATPEEVKLLMIDPKVVELSVYNSIPHLLIPVVTDPKKASSALNWAVMEMTERYKKFADNGVRDIAGYNSKEIIVEKMPQIVIIIDELADLMMVCPGEIEDYICRLAQMARAAGMHLVIATQRPSVDVITGLIKANIPSRISFAVSSQTDSRTILDMGGAEKLLGKGDMLYYPVGEAKPKRIQGAFITDKEVESIVDFIKTQSNTVYNETVLEQIEKPVATENGDVDSLLSDAIKLVVEYEQASASLLQRKLKIGYNRAACLIEEMEKRRIIGEYEGSKPRKVLLSKEELESLSE